jgi:hypothetical protein
VQDNAGWDRPVTASAAASVAPPATASRAAGPVPATPSWLDDVDDASDAGHPLSHPGHEESSPATADEADDLPGSGAAHHAWLSADSGAGIGTGDSFDLEATAALPIATTSPDADTSRESADADARSSLGAEAGPDLGDSDDGIDLEATAALPIATTSPDAGNAGGGAWSWLSADTRKDLNAEGGLGAEAGTNPDTDADLHASSTDPDAPAGADTDADAVLDGTAGAAAELPDAPDSDEPAPTGSDAPSDNAVTAASLLTGQVTVVPGVPRYHDEGCILIRFMDDEDLQRMTVPDAEKAGCTPCRACQHED